MVSRVYAAVGPSAVLLGTLVQLHGQTCLPGSWKALAGVHVLSGAWCLGRNAEPVLNISTVAVENKLCVFLLP